jgi:molybdenum cofactor guanylyltransferase
VLSDGKTTNLMASRGDKLPLMHRLQKVSGYVLAGGESRRMGRPKDQLVLAGETMLERQLRLLRQVARTVAVLGPAERSSLTQARVIPDDEPGLGPLGAICTALAATRTEFNLFLGCDMPLVEARFLQLLSREALRTQADVTVPESADHRAQPTCAVYRRRALPAVRTSLARGDYSVCGFFPRVRCRMIFWPEISRAGFRPRIFDNMNSPQDYEAAQLQLSVVSCQ